MAENGAETHGWRLKELERRMDAIERRIANAMYLLIANLLGIIAALAKLVFGG